MAPRLAALHEPPCLSLLPSRLPVLAPDNRPSCFRSRISWPGRARSGLGAGLARVRAALRGPFRSAEKGRPPELATEREGR